MKMPNHPQRKVLIAGATGLVGQEILRFLITDSSVTEAHVFSRRPLHIEHPKLHVHVVDFRTLPSIPAVDEVYLAIGTTIKVAGSQAAFRAADFDANLAVAKKGIEAGAKRIALVSAVGANANSSVFYTRTKGELENALAQLDLQALVFAQPSLLLGNRDALGQPRRIGEKIATAVSKIITPLLPAIYRPVYAHSVALSLVKILPTAEGKITLSSSDLIRIGNPEND